VPSRDPVLEPEEVIEVTVLPESQTKVRGWVEEMDGPRLRVRLNAEVPFAAPVKVECGTVILLGDVCHCEPGAEGFNVTITARHKLTLLPDLVRLNRILRGEEPPVTVDRSPSSGAIKM
jgi:hypothetical protein